MRVSTLMVDDDDDEDEAPAPSGSPLVSRSRSSCLRRRSTGVSPAGDVSMAVAIYFLVDGASSPGGGHGFCVRKIEKTFTTTNPDMVI